MKKALVVSAALAVVATASADVLLWFGPAPGNFKDQANFHPTYGNQIDGKDYSGDTGITAPAYTALYQIDPAVTKRAWVYFTFDNETLNAKLQGLHIGVGPKAPTDQSWYIGDDLLGTTGEKRWEAAYTYPPAPEFKSNPQLLWAVMAYGLQNRAAPALPFGFDGARRTAVLGTVEFADAKVGEKSTLYLGTLGISYKVNGPGKVHFGQVYFIPEPASLLLGLGGLLIRRR